MSETQLIPSEEVCYQIWMRKRAQVEAYGLNAPQDLIDDMNAWGRRWRNKVDRSLRPAKAHDEMAFTLLLKQFEKEWSNG